MSFRLPVIGLPGWGRSELMPAMSMRWGKTRTGRPRADRVAKAVSVNPRTVQRWFKGDDETLSLPAGRLDEILGLLRPTDESLAEERRQRIYAEDSLRELNLPPRRVKPEFTWIRDGWLDPHLVSVVSVKGWPETSRVVLCAETDASYRRLRAAGRILDSRLVANRFVGLALKIDFLTVMDGWRVMLTKGQVQKGGTQTWLSQAPAPDLGMFEILAYRYSKIGNPGD